MGAKRALTTLYHPQADGQTEILNQYIETALRAFIGSKDEWKKFIPALALSYNTTPHSSTTFSPAFLLRGFQPRTALLLTGTLPVSRDMDAGGVEDRGISGSAKIDNHGDQHANHADHDDQHANHANQGVHSQPISDERASNMIEEFEALRTRAKEALLLAQVFQRRAYNKGRINRELEVGDQVVINPHSLRLLRNKKGLGKKLLLKYDGPFEINAKLGPVTYRLRLPVSYGIHPVINIAHLEPYNTSPPELGNRPSLSLHRDDFEKLPEVEIDRIIAE
jgi:hypothetical protein